MHPHPWTSCLDFVFGIGLYLSPSDMALHPGNIQGYNNEIQKAGLDAAIEHNPGINEAEPIASKGDKAFQGQIALPAEIIHKGQQPFHFLRNKTPMQGTSAAPAVVDYAGEVLEFDVFKVCSTREGFIRLLECLYSGAT